MVPGGSGCSAPPALLQLLQAPGQFKVRAVLEPLLLFLPMAMPSTSHPACLPGAPLTTLLIAVVTTVVVTIAVPQAPDAVAVLAGELVFLTLPRGCGHRAVRLLQAVGPAPGSPAESLAEQSSQAALMLPKGA